MKLSVGTHLHPLTANRHIAALFLVIGERPDWPNTGQNESVSPPPLATGQSLVGEIHHFLGGDAERSGEFADIRQGYVSVSALDTTDVASVQIAFQGDCLLRQSLSSSELSQTATKQHPRIV